MKADEVMQGWFLVLGVSRGVIVCDESREAQRPSKSWYELGHICQMKFEFQAPRGTRFPR